MFTERQHIVYNSSGVRESAKIILKQVGEVVQLIGIVNKNLVRM